jgi:hypothetical protein
MTGFPIQRTTGVFLTRRVEGILIQGTTRVSPKGDKVFFARGVTGFSIQIIAGFPLQEG